LWPLKRLPQKDDIERMYKVAYYLDSKFFRKEDVVDLGLDLHKLKECGSVEMKKDLTKLRAMVGKVWTRMSSSAHVMFIYSYFWEHLRDMKDLLNELEIYIEKKSTGWEASTLDALSESLYRKFPEDLQKKIKSGFGKEWA
jgi:predicted transcriptional regulator